MSFRPEIVGSFSQGSSGNPTGAIMRAAFEQATLDWIYVNCEVEPHDFTDAVRGAAAQGWRGFNCSMPHKQRVIPMLDELVGAAEICSAVNCVVRTKNGWAGHNTDGAGFVAAVREFRSPEGAEVLIIGGGGAATAIACEMALAGAGRLHLATRSPNQSARIVDLVKELGTASSVLPWSERLVLPSSTEIVVNATPVGTNDDDDQIPLDWSTVGPDLLVGDVVVDPPETAFLAKARKAGATTADGTGMLIRQAAANVKIWTGIDVPLPPLRDALELALGRRRATVPHDRNQPRHRD